MELARELLHVGASGDILDNMLPVEAPRSEGKRVAPSFWTRLAAYAALVPAVDFLSDCAMFTALLDKAQSDWALGVAAVAMLFLRFSCLYAAIGPSLTLRNFCILYFPCVLLPLLRAELGSGLRRQLGLVGWSCTARYGVDDLRRIHRHRDAGNAPDRDRHPGTSVGGGALVSRVTLSIVPANRVTE